MAGLSPNVAARSNTTLVSEASGMLASAYGLFQIIFLGCLSDDRPAAVDGDDLAGDVVRGICRKKHRDALELSRISDARDRAVCLDVGLYGWDPRILHPGVEEARRDCGDAHALPTPGGGQLPCQPHQPSLAGRVGRVVRTADRDRKSVV